MSDKNIDKDIEILKDMKGFFSDCEVCTDDCDEKTCVYLRAIENVLSELERLDKSDTSKEKSSMDYYNKYKEIKSDLETWKKIAEKLAIEVENLDDMLSAELGSHTRGYCRIENSCIFNYKRKCSECIIDWARKEVEKDVP